MAEPKYSVGDIVTLKSGGPEMTVNSIPGGYSKSYICQWFAGKKLEQGGFPENSLELARQKDED
jgi:uncharacterized protein YodC (DUF2158 family)